LWKNTPLAKNTDYFKNGSKKFKRFELSPQLGLKNICIVFFFMKERKIKNPLKYMPFKPYKKNHNY
jgi:hypothetical protein